MNPTHALGQFLRTLPHSAAATFLALFPIVDPFGGIPIFFSMTSTWTTKDRNWTALKTGVWVFAILVTFLFVGRFVLSFFGISLPVLKIAGGLIVEESRGRAAEAGIQPGDVVLSVDGTPVHSVEDLRKLVQQHDKQVALLIQRGDSRIFIPVTLG